MGSILYITYPLNTVIIFALVIGLGVFLTRRFRLGWRVWWIGAAAFALSQVFHLPFNSFLNSLIRSGAIPLPLLPIQRAILLAVIFGLSAGAFESAARFLAYRFWAPEARSWGGGLLLGAGHGGFEAVIIGLYLAYVYIQVMLLTFGDLQSQVPADQLPLLQQQLDAYWSVPWHLSLLPALERLFTLPLHLAASVLVLQVFTRRQIRWLFLAILWHAFCDGVGAVYLPQVLGMAAAEAGLGLMALASLGIVLALRQPQPQAEEVFARPSPARPLEPASLPPLPETAENLDRTRYDP